MVRDEAGPSNPHEVTLIQSAGQLQGNEDTSTPLLPMNQPDPHVPDHFPSQAENQREDLRTRAREIVGDRTATAPPQHQGMSQVLDVESGSMSYEQAMTRPSSVFKQKGLNALISTETFVKRSTKEEAKKKKPDEKADNEKPKTGVKAAMTVWEDGGKGSVLAPFMYCMAEQFCLYSREHKQWCCHASINFLHDGKRFRWESWVVAGYVVLVGLIAVLAWRLIDGAESGDTEQECVTLDPEEGVIWTLVTMGYILLAVGGAVPVAYKFFQPGNYSKIGKEDAFDGDKCLLISTYYRRVNDVFDVIDEGRASATELSQRGNPTATEIKVLAQQHAKDCVAIRRGLEGALVTWSKWVVQYRLFNTYVIFVQIVSSIGVPLLSQLTTCQASSTLLLTIVSTHAGITLALEKALRSTEKYRSYRIAESAALDTWRRMVHMPWTFTSRESPEPGADPNAIFQIMREEFTCFVQQIEDTRDFARQIETYSGSKETEATRHGKQESHPAPTAGFGPRVEAKAERSGRLPTTAGIAAKHHTANSQMMSQMMGQHDQQLQGTGWSDQ